MSTTKAKKKIGVLGGGPSALFMFKRLVDSGISELEVTIFERKSRLGVGMPYSDEGACREHITNVSDNEIPELVTSMKDWLQKAPTEMLKTYDLKADTFNEYKVVPRLLFGQYLEAQFDLLQKQARKIGIKTHLQCNTTVIDIIDDIETEIVKVITAEAEEFYFDTVIICTGHNWPKKNEGKVEGWFDSPYPPAKLARKTNCPVAIKGASLSAIDVVRTLARCNGSFAYNGKDIPSYQVHEESKGFQMVMHSLDGLLPAIRFHLEDSHLSKESLLTEEEVRESKKANGGFIPLDYIFDHNFLQPLRKQNPEFYEKVKDLSLEEFVDYVMDLREKLDAFTLFKAEYEEAERSIKRQQSVYWKEMLAVLSYAMNYPAKHLSAEDMIRLKKKLMPLIAIVIAFVPQSSCREMIALYDAGILSLVAVDKESKVEPAENGGAVYTFANEAGEIQTRHYKMFVDAVGQPPFMYKDFPFAGLRNGQSISPAYLRFKSGEAGEKELNENNPQVEKDSQDNYYLAVPGININDSFQVLDKYGANNDRIYIMAVPYIGGLNPDYSGLDFCEEASGRIVETMLQPIKDQLNQFAET